jgi:hypothetical protein
MVRVGQHAAAPGRDETTRIISLCGGSVTSQRNLKPSHGLVGSFAMNTRAREVPVPVPPTQSDSVTRTTSESMNSITVGPGPGAGAGPRASRVGP